MKQATNFRLDEAILNTIGVLAKDLHTSKTNIVEKAVLQYAASLASNRNSLLQFAGSLNADDADTMLETIQQDKNRKDDDLHL
ncbi:MAG: hypothetical protein HOP02_05220 [Methylococcaceae bacterium]|nr:hypothetical protein [Methylococcaceae bacterium]